MAVYMQVTQDDGISVMDISVYVQRRLHAKLGSLREDLPKKERKYKVLHFQMECNYGTD
jgi:hypothetical protein